MKIEGGSGALEKTNVENSGIVMYTVSDIQSIFKCGRKQAYELFHINGFPCIRIGKKMLVEKAALEKWLMQNRGKKVS